MKKTLLILIWTFPVLCLKAGSVPDSLLAVWQDERNPDSVRAFSYKSYIWNNYLYSRPDSAFILAEELLAFGLERDYQKARALGYNIQGASWYLRGDYPRAFSCYSSSLEICEQSGDRKGIAQSLNNIGLIYVNQGDYPRALAYYTRSLKIDETFGDQKGIAQSLNNIGIIYNNQGDYPMALEYFTRSLQIKEQIGDQKGVAASLNNIGIVYQDEGDYPKALEYHTRSLDIKKEIGDQMGMAPSLHNIGIIYKNLGEFSTGNEGYTELFLPPGNYRLELKNKDGQFEKNKDFTIAVGQEIEIVQNIGTFRVQLFDPNSNELSNHRIKFYRYDDGKIGQKILEKATDENGEVETILSTGNYVLEIDGIYKGLNYITEPIFINEDLTQNYEYILSKARIIIKNENNQDIKNALFYIYHDNKEEIGKFSTGSLGFFDIYLPPGKYIIKEDTTGNSFKIFIEPQQLNKITLSLFSGYADVDTGLNSMVNDSLYNKDTDGDGLSDFEEIYFYKTNPYDQDTDSDGYFDNLEIKNGYDPNSIGKYLYPIFSYDKPRLSSLYMEQDIARSLRFALNQRIAKIEINAEDWHTIVNSYIYGGYSISEIVNTLVYGPGQVHPTIPASAWRKK